MDDDPWADTPPSPRVSSPASPAVARGSPSVKSPSKLINPPTIPSPSDPFDDVDPYADTPSADVAVAVALPVTPIPPTGTHDNDGFDDFDDFDEPVAGPSSPRPLTANKEQGGFVSAPVEAGGDEDGFGDFGDFEEGDFEEATLPNQGSLVQEPEVVQDRWRALSLRPFPPTSELLTQLSDLLPPPLTALHDEPVRSVGGLSQIMVSESSRDAYAQLTTAPMLKPLDWTRSRVRREHLISMGVPVNLDEVDSHRLSALPPLRITTTAGSAGSSSRPHPRANSLDMNGSGRIGLLDNGKGKGKGRDISPSPQSAPPGGRANKYGLGEQPYLDTGRAEELCGLEEDRLSLLPLASLKKLQEDLVATSAQASASLAWLLQVKDALTQDSVTYNGMISELIANAAKAKSAQQTGSGGVFRKSSLKVKAASGASTPRVGSPAIR